LKRLFTDPAPFKSARQKIEEAVKGYDSFFISATFRKTAGLEEKLGVLADGTSRWATILTIDTRKLEILDWICCEDIDVKHRALKSRRAKDSGTWFLGYPEFELWVSGLGPNIMYCFGHRTSRKVLI
jgi:hypothetical protein